MKKLLLLGSLLASGALLQDVSVAHGGTYRGPGDTVPPGAGGGAGGTGPAVPGPTGPSVPGPGSSTPGPSTPGFPGGVPGVAGGNPATGGVGGSLDLTQWDFWWGFNKDPYLNLKSKIHGPGVRTGSDDWYLGHGAVDQAKDTLRPSARVIRDKVVPALVKALEEERAHDILDSSLIALAKIGDQRSEDGRSEFEEIIKGFLQSPSQQVAETAAIALGILANDASVPTLVALMKDEPDGRRLVGKNQVPLRTRAFAAYGVGLIGYRTSDNGLRQDIAEHLIDILESPHFSRRDIKVGAITALGLTPIDPSPQSVAELVAALPEEERTRGPGRHVVSREAQIDYLLDYFDPQNERANKSTRHWFVRAHAPAAMARLLAGAAPEKRAQVARLLLAGLDEHSDEEKEIQMGCALALGQIGTAGASELDRTLRAALVRLVEDGEPQVRRFALIAMAQAGGTPGEGERALEGAEDVRRELLSTLSRGRSGLKPWAGLAIGVMGRRLADKGRSMSDLAGDALRDAAEGCRTPQDIGAYLIGLGLRKDTAAKALCLEKLDFFKGSDDARGYAAVALGLMEERAALEPIQEIVRDSKYKPELLKQAAIALGLLGDSDLVDDLIRMLAEAKGLATQAAISSALGAIGDARSIDPLVEMLGDDRLTDAARGFAAAALGIVCDKEDFPWNSKIAVDINYRASTVTLTGEMGTGILDLL